MVYKADKIKATQNELGGFNPLLQSRDLLGVFLYGK